MRNLKRALSLALSTVMLLGMMVVGTSASYKDVSSENNKEAIEVLQAVGVMVGDENGNFNPEQKVTRNEMAVIMSNMLDYKVSNYAGTAPFTDVPAWAEPYVAACYTHGIIAGYSNSYFGGNDSVTTAQASLMMMKALGYFQYSSDFGEDWQLATIRQANKIDLYNDVDSGARAAMTRNDVAQLALNTLEATQVDVSGEPAKVVMADGTTVYMGAAEYYELWKSGDRYKTIYAGTKSNGDKYTAQLGEDLFAGKLEKDITDMSDDFGRPAVKWTYKDKTIGKYAGEEAALTYVEGFDADELADLEKDGYDFDGAPVYLNGADVTKLGYDADELADRDYKGTAIEVYADGKDVTRIVVIQGYLAQVTDVDDEDITLDIYNPWMNMNKGEDKDSVTIEDNSKSDDDWFDRLSATYEKDDYMIVYTEAGNVDGDIIAVADVETVEGKVKTVKVGALNEGYNGTFTMDGTKYTLASAYNEVEIKAGSEYTFFMDENGYVIGAKAASDEAALEDYLFVKATGTSGFDNIAKVMFMDGSSKTVTVAELEDDDDFTWKAADAKKFYTFKENKNGEYELELVTGKVTQFNTTAAIEDDATPIAGVRTAANSSTLFIAKDKTYTGVKNAPEVAEGAVYYMVKDNRLMVVYAETEGSSSIDADELVYVLSADYAEGLDEDDDAYYEYDVFMNGEKTTLLTREDDLTAGLYQIKSYEDDLYAEFEDKVPSELVTEVKGVVDVDYADDTLTLGKDENAVSYLLADGVKIYTVDGTTVKSIGATSIENRVEDLFNDLILIKADKDDKDISIIFMVK